MGNGALPHGPSYRAHPRLYIAEIDFVIPERLFEAFEIEAPQPTADVHDRALTPAGDHVPGQTACPEAPVEE